MASKDFENKVADCAPCADSNSRLKEHMKKLDDMELLDNKEAPSEETSYYK